MSDIKKIKEEFTNKLKGDLDLNSVNQIKTDLFEKNGKIITESIRTLELDTGEIIKLPLAVGIWNAVDSGHIESIEMLLNELSSMNSLSQTKKLI